MGPELAGNGITGLIVEENDLNCGAPGVMMITALVSNAEPPVENDFNISGSQSHVILGPETSDNWFINSEGLLFDKAQDDGTNNRFEWSDDDASEEDNSDDDNFDDD